MLFEHWIYSTAIAVIAGMVHFKRTDLSQYCGTAPVRYCDSANTADRALQVCRRLSFRRYRVRGHIFEDALVANPAYAFFWHFSDQKFGIGMIEFNPDCIIFLRPGCFLQG